MGGGKSRVILKKAGFTRPFAHLRTFWYVCQARGCILVSGHCLQKIQQRYSLLGIG
jgi:hypothetical protein